MSDRDVDSSLSTKAIGHGGRRVATREDDGRGSRSGWRRRLPTAVGNRQRPDAAGNLSRRAASGRPDRRPPAPRDGLSVPDAAGDRGRRVIGGRHVWPGLRGMRRRGRPSLAGWGVSPARGAGRRGEAWHRRDVHQSGMPLGGKEFGYRHWRDGACAELREVRGQEDVRGS